jgi:opacity protein-like surface antigen
MLPSKKLLLVFSLLVTINCPAQKTTHNWTGFYIGPNAGAGFYKLSLYNPPPEIITVGGSNYPVGNVSLQNITNLFVQGRGIVIVPGFTKPAPEGISKKTSFTGGIQMGYMKQFGNLVAGLEGDINYLSTKVNAGYDSLTLPTALQWQANLGIHHTVSTTFTESIRAKIGYAIKNSLVYFTVGGSFANMKTAAMDSWNTTTYWAQPWIDNAPHPTPATHRFVTTANNETTRVWASGLTFGIGYDWACSKYCTLGIEYRYFKLPASYTTSASPYDTVRIDSRPTASGSIGGISEKIKLINNQVTLRLNLSLGSLLNNSKNSVGNKDMKKE